MPNTYQAVFTIGYQYLGRGPVSNSNYKPCGSRAAVTRIGISTNDERHPNFRHMKIHRSNQSGLTLAEFSITMGVVGALGLVIYSLLNMGTILGAKNTATNTAHQRARIAMLDMIQDLHGAVSLPALQGVVGNEASGISFQQWGSVPVNGEMIPNGGPHKIVEDETVGADHIHIFVTQTEPAETKGRTARDHPIASNRRNHYQSQRARRRSRVGVRKTI